MRSSSAFLLLGLLVAIVLLISSEVAARDLAETSTENGVNDAKHDDRGYPGGGYPGGGGGGGYPGGGGGGYPGHGGGGGYPGHGGGGGYPGHGGGGGGYPGHGGGGGYPGHGGGGGGRCRFGCCGSGYYQRCRCCASAAEAAQKAAEVKPQN